MSNRKDKTRKEHNGKTKETKLKKEIEQGEQLMQDLGLSKSEKNFIYDLIEEDFEVMNEQERMFT